MRTRLTLAAVVVSLIHVAFGSTTAVAQAPPVTDQIADGQNIRFRFTVDGGLFRGVWQWRATCSGTKLASTVSGVFDWSAEGGTFAGKACSFEFVPPAEATDWEQKIIDKDGSSNVFAGNIKKDSPWSFQLLDLLPAVTTRIPDLAPIADDPNVTIYTAVNLELYMTTNPLGFLDGDWTVGQTLSGLGITIVNGQVAGVEGIYWATTPFEFDPDPNGRGFTPVGGDGNLLSSATYAHDSIILQQHVTVPEPATVTLLALALLALLGGAACRRTHLGEHVMRRFGPAAGA